MVICHIQIQALFAYCLCRQTVHKINTQSLKELKVLDFPKIQENVIFRSEYKKLPALEFSAVFILRVQTNFASQAKLYPTRKYVSLGTARIRILQHDIFFYVMLMPYYNAFCMEKGCLNLSKWYRFTISKSNLFSLICKNRFYIFSKAIALRKPPHLTYKRAE